MSELHNHPHHSAERAYLFTSRDGGSLEDDVADFLYGLIRAFKPMHILETGTYLGTATEVMAKACLLNGVGTIETLESSSTHAARATQLFGESPALSKIVKVIHQSSLTFLPQCLRDNSLPYDFAFLDSDLKCRVEELKLLSENRLLQGVALVHDTSRLRHYTYDDYPDYPNALDSLNLPYIECPWSRGWRLYQINPNIPR